MVFSLAHAYGQGLVVHLLDGVDGGCARFVGAHGRDHVGHFLNHVDIWKTDITFVVRVGVAGIEDQLEGTLVRHHAGYPDALEFAVVGVPHGFVKGREHVRGFHVHGLADVRSAFRGAGGVDVGQVHGHGVHVGPLCGKPGSGHVECGHEVHYLPPSETILLMPLKPVSMMVERVLYCRTFFCIMDISLSRFTLSPPYTTRGLNSWMARPSNVPESNSDGMCLGSVRVSLPRASRSRADCSSCSNSMRRGRQRGVVILARLPMTTF
eukprot:TRINITY_DN9282_c0_g1_i2.p2 TRINITY_DN9282_c0_g1~~TRINITY_DN9282_c0_g1_i2.p2  ORF type:complete len:266 (+),score=42.00 TRINITY_DN9282_c0_g1_i2:658-1455(+)